MKKICALLMSLAVSANCMAGLIVSSDALDYKVGDTININFSYESAAPLGNLLEAEFDASTFFTFSEDIADFDIETLPSEYVDADPLSLVEFDTFSNEWFYSLSTFGPSAPFQDTDIVFDLGTLSFIAKGVGNFLLDVSVFTLSDFGSFFDEDQGVTGLNVNVNEANVISTPPLTAMLLLSLGIFIRHKIANERRFN